MYDCVECSQIRSHVIAKEFTSFFAIELYACREYVKLCYCFATILRALHVCNCKLLTSCTQNFHNGCFSTFYRCTMAPTLAENAKFFCVLVLLKAVCLTSASLAVHSNVIEELQNFHEL